LAHQDPHKSISGRHPENDLDRFTIIKSSIAAQNERLAFDVGPDCRRTIE